MGLAIIATTMHRAPPTDALRLIVGAALVFVVLWAVRATMTVSRLLLRPRLDRAARQVIEDSAARLRLIEDFSAMLCRIERHLHNGAQDRVVTMTMRLSVMREQMASATGPGADAARELLDAAHHDAMQVIAELRDLGRGIRPPALAGGLAPAIDSLAAHSPVPIDLRVGITDRPSARIETVAYFCACELLADIREHGASSACMEIAQHDQSLLLRVSYDDTAGRATPKRRRALAGATNYVRSVDGTLSVDSPECGQTLVTALIPFRL